MKPRNLKISGERKFERQFYTFTGRGSRAIQFSFIDGGSARVLVFALDFTAIVQSSLSAPSGACRAIPRWEFRLQAVSLEFRLQAVSSMTRTDRLKAELQTGNSERLRTGNCVARE